MNVVWKLLHNVGLKFRRGTVALESVAILSFHKRVTECLTQEFQKYYANRSRSSAVPCRSSERVATDRWTIKVFALRSGENARCFGQRFGRHRNPSFAQSAATPIDDAAAVIRAADTRFHSVDGYVRRSMAVWNFDPLLLRPQQSVRLFNSRTFYWLVLFMFSHRNHNRNNPFLRRLIRLVQRNRK